LAPTLGVVTISGSSGDSATLVIADIPGLIPGASEGVGLGIQFLRHVERTRVLLHLVTLDAGEGREALADYRAIRGELEKYSPELAQRPEVVVLSKADVTEVREAFPALRARFARARIRLGLVSAATHEGIPELLDHLFRVTRGSVSAADRPRPASEIVLPEETKRRKPSAIVGDGEPKSPRKAAKGVPAASRPTAKKLAEEASEGGTATKATPSTRRAAKRNGKTVGKARRT
jgi:GTP-binding protein